MLTTAKIVDGTTYLEGGPMSMSSIRKKVEAPIIPYPGGWHLDYFGDVIMIQDKIKSFAHQEYNKDEYLDEMHLRQALEEGKDLFGRMYNMTKVPLEENTYLPQYYQMLVKGKGIRRLR